MADKAKEYIINQIYYDDTDGFGSRMETLKKTEVKRQINNYKTQSVTNNWIDQEKKSKMKQQSRMRMIMTMMMMKGRYREWVGSG